MRTRLSGEPTKHHESHVIQKPMKSTLIILSFAVLIAAGTENPTSAQQIKGMTQKLEYRLDERGNTELAIRTDYNASEWNVFKKTLGTNAALLKRHYVREMPKLYLTDFKYDEDPMERNYTIRMKALGLVYTNEKGEWISELGVDQSDVIRVSDREFTMKLNFVNERGALIEQTHTYYLPQNATNVTVSEDMFGAAVLAFRTETGLMSMVRSIGGIVLMLVGVCLFFIKW